MRLLVWDLPTRLFHWLFAGSFLASFAIAEFVDKDNSLLFNLHIALGTFAGILLVWRIVWGFVGSRHARFGSLFFSPRETLDYFKSVLSGRGKYHAGHNPGSAPVILGLLLIVSLTIFSGYLQSFAGDWSEEVHEVLPKIGLALAAAHVGGVLLASRMNKENYVLAMFHGKKTAQPHEGITSARPFAALLMLALTFTAMAFFHRSFDRATGILTLPVTGTQIAIGEEADEN